MSMSIVDTIVNVVHVSIRLPFCIIVVYMRVSGGGSTKPLRPRPREKDCCLGIPHKPTRALLDPEDSVVIRG